MRRRTISTTMALLFLTTAGAFAQTDNARLKIFGYFQVALSFQRDLQTQRAMNSFTLQQLNLFLQKDLAQDWTAFINFEFVNSYSSLLNWGAFSLEEAWINYRSSDQFKIKLGLLTPTFNNLNEIKNRTPLLPYIIRPVIYESSFQEAGGIEEFVPGRAFVQAYGFIPAGETKFDYAVYLGNSPNINTDNERSETGVDTVKTFLLGGRAGMRYKFFKAGVSATYDELDFVEAGEMFNLPAADFQAIPRTRFGADLSYQFGKWMLEAEYVRMKHELNHPQFDFDKEFYYGTLGYHFSERLFVYGSYWIDEENYLPVGTQAFQVPTFGITYNLNDVIVFKAQTARVHFDVSNFATGEILDVTVGYTFFAVSVVF